MRVLVLGGIRSGKSQWAEAALADAAPAPQPLRYLATGPDPGGDDEWAARIASHRQRRESRWFTVETTDVATQLGAESVPTLVDDAGAWLTATMDRIGAWTGAKVGTDVEDLVDAVAGYQAPLAVVSPEVGLTVVPATAAGRRFADELGALNQRLAAVCDRVVLVVAGQPVTVKEAV
ncbi:adenosylcobinamide kinase /adenosylcobinamide-phosphate guanylyltransferase [Mycolicibacterium rutilum]|uniref:Adenosylcobinamide kinase n=1 Tax=Mycolicibacterium rutilum TaxID=370526 RepID=A0A1H6KUA7_MYCRU|nr:bifunctional adenosylcobinamide kinase/adenosylcobinamide-phosphate guanylyltransferase [Mycolicibacterium rutilum]SEH75273.1 adenosylcobinamide kinase /adenosylcobinamide-phosphate guanylyltransferase [Mycolicibacterium rutilum]